MQHEQNSNKHFVAGFIAGRRDKENGYPRDPHLDREPEHNYYAGYDAAWDRQGRLVVEFY